MEKKEKTILVRRLKQLLKQLDRLTDYTIRLDQEGKLVDKGDYLIHTANLHHSLTYLECALDELQNLKI